MGARRGRGSREWASPPSSATGSQWGMLHGVTPRDFGEGLLPSNEEVSKCCRGVSECFWNLEEFNLWELCVTLTAWLHCCGILKNPSGLRPCPRSLAEHLQPKLSWVTGASLLPNKVTPQLASHWGPGPGRTRRSYSVRRGLGGFSLPDIHGGTPWRETGEGRLQSCARDSVNPQ